MKHLIILWLQKKTNTYYWLSPAENLKKKILALLFITITIFMTVQPIIYAITPSGGGKWVAGQWDSRIFTTENKNNVGMLLRRLVNYTTGEKITTFCRRTFC